MRVIATMRQILCGGPANSIFPIASLHKGELNARTYQPSPLSCTSVATRTTSSNPFIDHRLAIYMDSSPRKILMLHGYAQSAAIFSARASLHSAH